MGNYQASPNHTETSNCPEITILRDVLRLPNRTWFNRASTRADVYTTFRVLPPVPHRTYLRRCGAPRRKAHIATLTLKSEIEAHDRKQSRQPSLRLLHCSSAAFDHDIRELDTSADYYPLSFTEYGIPALSGVPRLLEMDPVHSAQMQHLQELLARLLTLDQLLGSVPLQQQRNLDLEAALSTTSRDLKLQGDVARYTTLSSDVEELYRILNRIPRFDLIPATLLYIFKTSWQGRIYQNLYRHSDVAKPRDPTCSEVLHLLPKLDRILETSLSIKISSIVALVPPFRFLDLPTELRLCAYAYILPRQPYLTLINVEPRRHALPRYDLAILRTCRRIYSELINHFYKDQVLVMNVYNIDDYSWAIKSTSPRDRLLVLNMRRDVRSCFQRLEIRLLDMKDPDTDRKGSYWEAMERDIWEWDGDAWQNLSDFWNSDTYFTETIEAFPDLKSATISFELKEVSFRGWWGAWRKMLGDIAKYLISEMPQHVEVKWDFQATSHPDLWKLDEEGLLKFNEDEYRLMEIVKGVVAEETAKKGGTVQLGKGLIKDSTPWTKPLRE
ncbi:hypothetical protein BU23DRAFT_564510 [Bimuria novae-zelandiae CBS 107.79]|uniref:F-box domain-containing protein n=1 Tax=Bimuria novae-zelandiae CBS 107.79 TaxID=1447943 RepID=A0A6A5VRE9_9PLEO|nr:hypothetical protein BU23DRAFT_564510 [Bimuria novae-zelandiae CBS 107.79]